MAIKKTQELNRYVTTKPNFSYSPIDGDDDDFVKP